MATAVEAAPFPGMREQIQERRFLALKVKNKSFQLDGHQSLTIVR